MDLDNHHHYQPHHNPGSLMRFRSAPSSFFAGLIGGGGGGGGEFVQYEDFPKSPDSEAMFERLVLSANGSGDADSGGMRESTSPQMEMDSVPQPQTGFSAAPSVIYQPPSSLQPLHAHSSVSVVNSMGAAGNCSNLMRQTSSPPGLFDSMTVDNGFSIGRDAGIFPTGNGANGGGEVNLSTRMNFPKGPPRHMPQIAEIGMESMDTSSSENGISGNASDGGSNGCYSIPSFASDSNWDDSVFGSMERSREHDHGKMFTSFSALGAQNGNAGNTTPGLAHHLSLPKNSSAEMAIVENFLRFQDSVPCKVRAKRGCATHPRSIAERMRRTRISERMRKLQELFPNMDKQTNTADMLELAVEYIKNLQKQVKTLTDTRANCTCSSRQQQFSDPIA
ncbi:transcription factor bHLH130-like [Malania oleifera]|uniref:transcription factor bHLH130-like n=1 Tax=Malania oleifera TaxID=397392 RepID=UPI0025ADAA1C|nr:transcription factor bHLH130-like [Malania oleifera]XP_057978709.1 transcription factor bHLH130-like [Malania oleifera]XP_057978710.1 transcription factor bHLH130-like [Malania oleifera]